MITINLVGGELKDGKLIGGSITGSANGKNFGVKYTEEKYKQMTVLAEKANAAEEMSDLLDILADFEPFMQDGYKELVETACPNIVVNEETGKFYLKTTDGTVISSKALPQALVDRILVSVEKKIDFLPIVKAWTRFLRNPHYSEQKAIRFANYVNQTTIDHDLKKELIEEKGVAPAVAIERATVFQTPITQEGLICTYKVSKEILVKFDPETGKQAARYKGSYDENTGEYIDGAIPEHVEDRLFEPAVMGKGGDAFFCYPLNHPATQALPKPGHFIRVGYIHELEKWEQVNTRDNQSCCEGLHVGNLDYIRGYQTKGTVTHNTFVDPMDIGAITDDGSGALRVRRYFTHSSTAGINRSIYHSSRFAAKTDEDWDKFRLEAIKESEAKAEKAAALAQETAAI